MKKVIITLIALVILGLLLTAGLFVAAIGAIILPIYLLLRGSKPAQPNFQNEEPTPEIKGETIDVEFTRIKETENQQ